MNIAFPAVLIILLILPGVVFNKRRSVSGLFGIRREISEEIFPSLSAASVAHLVWVFGCYLISGWTGLVVDIEAVLLLVSGRLGEQQNSVEALKAASDHPRAVFLYFSSLLLACYCAGWLDRRFRVWWHGRVRALMVFSAEDESQARRFAAWARILSIDLPVSEMACTTIVASLTVGSKSYLYAGLLRDVFWNESTGEPEWLQLWSTHRRDIAADGDAAAKTPERWYEVEGESFMIRFSEVGTLNLIYTTLEESDKNSESNATASPK